MKIYLVERRWAFRTDNQYDKLVVVAKDESEARLTHPGGTRPAGTVDGMWPVDHADLSVTEIGEAASGRRGVVLASFNAG